MRQPPYTDNSQLSQGPKHGRAPQFPYFVPSFLFFLLLLLMFGFSLSLRPDDPASRTTPYTQQNAASFVSGCCLVFRPITPPFFCSLPTSFPPNPIRSLSPPFFFPPLFFVSPPSMETYYVTRPFERHTTVVATRFCEPVISLDPMLAQRVAACESPPPTEGLGLLTCPCSVHPPPAGGRVALTSTGLS
jgi:hypothetical protein